MKSIIDVKNLSFRYKESQEYYDVKGITSRETWRMAFDCRA